MLILIPAVAPPVILPGARFSLTRYARHARRAVPPYQPSLLATRQQPVEISWPEYALLPSLHHIGQSQIEEGWQAGFSFMTTNFAVPNSPKDIGAQMRRYLAIIAGGIEILNRSNINCADNSICCPADNISAKGPRSLAAAI